MATNRLVRWDQELLAGLRTYVLLTEDPFDKPIEFLYLERPLRAGWGRLSGGRHGRGARIHPPAGGTRSPVLLPGLIRHAAFPVDRATFFGVDERSQHQHGDLMAMDRSIGTLCAGLRELRIERNTLGSFTSDNRALPRIDPGTDCELRGFRGSLSERGLRVLPIIEWPAGVAGPRVTSVPADTTDIFTTVPAIAGPKDEAMLQPQDGIDLEPQPVRRLVGATSPPDPAQARDRNNWQRPDDR